MMLEGQLVLVRSSKLITLEDKAETFHLFFAISAVDLKHARQTVEGFDFFLNLSLFSGHIAPPFWVSIKVYHSRPGETTGITEIFAWEDCYLTRISKKLQGLFCLPLIGLHNNIIIFPSFLFSSFYPVFYLTQFEPYRLW